MKPQLQILSAALLAAFVNPGLARAETRVADANGHAEARAEAHADGQGAKTSTHKQTVTVTSDGKRTVKKTVTVRDGKEEVMTEVTDENGKTTVDRGEGGARPDPQADREEGAWLGVRVKEAPAALREQLDLAGDEGVVIEMVAPAGPAAKAGLRVNDLLLQLAGRRLATAEDLRAELRKHAAGETVAVEYLRKGARATVEVTLQEKPAAEGAKEPPPEAQGLLEKTRRKLQTDNGSGTIEVEVSGDAGGGNGSAGLDAVLNNPDVPEDFKKTVREMREKMREFEQKHHPRD